MNISILRVVAKLASPALIGHAMLAVVLPQQARAQTHRACATDRTVSTWVGAGLGAAAAAIPATIVHRHDQTTSLRILIVGISAGAVIGFLAAGHDQPCASPSSNTRTPGDSPRATVDSMQLANAIVARRSRHAGRGAIAGAVIGGALGAVGGTFYEVGCTTAPCHANRSRVNLMLFSAGEGAIALGLLGGLIGWAWPN